MKLIKILLIFAVLIVIALTVVYFSLGGIVKKSVETAGPELLGVPVTTEAVQIDPASTAFKLNDLLIGNPEKYTQEHAFKMDTFALDVEPMSLLSDTVHVEALVIDGASLVIEGLQADNHRDIIKNIQERLGGSGKSSEGGESSGGEDEPAEAKKVIVDLFAFTNSELVLLVDGTEIARVDFPEIKLEQIGSKGSGVTIAEAAMQIYSAIMTETAGVLTADPEILKKLGDAKLNNLGLPSIESLKEMGEDTLNAIGDLFK